MTLRSQSNVSETNQQRSVSGAGSSLHGAGVRSRQLTALLDGALSQVLDRLAQGAAAPGLLAETLLAAVQGAEVICARLDLRPPCPGRLILGQEQQFSEQLQEAQLPNGRRVLLPQATAWPATLSPAGSLVLLPLCAHEAEVGMLSLWLHGARPRLPRTIQRFTSGLAAALLAAAEQQMLRTHIQSMQELQAAVLEVGATLNMPELQNTVISVARRIFGADQAWFLSYDEAQGLYSSGEISHPLSHSAMLVIRSAIAANHPCALVAPEGPAAFACSNVTIGAQNLGILLLQREKPYSEYELKLLADLASSVGQALRNAHIYQDSQETFAELRNALDKLIQAERLRALGEIARGVAHDFNNLLTIISSHTQFLLETSNAEQTHELEQIRSAIREGAETVNRLREFTHAAIEEPQQRISLNQLIHQVFQLIRPLIRRIEVQRHAAIAVKLELQELEEIPGNPGELREMLMQMLHNSLDALPAGGVIRLRTWQETVYACLQISDDGVGMAEEVRRRVFDPFFTTKAMRGTGLGLSLVYGVVRRHGGTIDVESIPGSGTTFTIRLPLMRGTFLAEAI